MLHLVTGANGACKTLNTLKWVMDRATKEGRPVCHNGRFKVKAGGPLEAWKEIPFEKWQDEPDGTIFLIDECHNDLPIRPSTAPTPDHIRMLAEHRARGFDFYLITQHPANIDTFVRRLIGPPGWHRHIKRPFSGNLVSIAEYPAVELQCEKQGAGKKADTTMQTIPVEVFDWYESATLHTVKRNIPKKVWVLLGCLLGFVLCIAVALYIIKTKVMVNDDKDKPAAQSISSPAAASAGTSSGNYSNGPMTVHEFVASHKPRLEGLPQTASRYDELTRPKVAPYPAICMSMGPRCECYTQQNTKLQTPQSMCEQIVQNGLFVDWQEPVQHRSETPARAHQVEERPRSQTVPVPPEMQAKPVQLVNQGLVATNAQARAEAGGYGPRMSESISVLGR